MAAQFESVTANLANIFTDTKVYKVPLFQRNYAWTEEQWEVLWEDLLAVKNQSETFHYMGPLIFQADEEIDDRFLVIDGQQRLATLSLLGLAGIHRFLSWAHNASAAGRRTEEEENFERAEHFRRRFVGQREPTALYYRSRLELNRIDNPFFQDLLRDRYKDNQPVLSGLPESHRRLFRCYRFFIEKLTQEFSSPQGLAQFLEQQVSKGILFTRIVVADDANAYLIFETLNARGIELAPNDLIKNYIFSTLSGEAVPTSDIDLLIAKWDKTLESLGSREFIHCLRAYANSRTRPVVRQDRLFRYVKSEVTDRDTAQKFVEDVEEKGELYFALRNPAHEFWNAWSEQQRMRFYLSLIRMFSVRQHVPLVFAVYDKIRDGHFEEQLLADLMRDIAIISFRYNVIGRRNPNLMETVYNEIATQVRGGDLDERSKIREKLRVVYLPDDEFRQSFANVSFSARRYRRLVKYILLSLESYRQHTKTFRMDRPEILGQIDDSRITIEHVLPEKLTDEWSTAIEPHDHETWVHRLGNLTVLEDNLNREAGNRTFEEKREVYRQSNYRLAREIAQREVWSAGNILQRQQELADDAVRIWRIDF